MLPIYLLLDTSASMRGEKIEAVGCFVQELLSVLRQDPYALEMAHVSVITFNDSAKVLFPLTPISEVEILVLSVYGQANLGAAFELTAQRIAVEVTQNTSENQRKKKPWIVLVTDGAPSDNWRAGFEMLLAQPHVGLIVLHPPGSDIKGLLPLAQREEMCGTIDSALFKNLLWSFVEFSPLVSENSPENILGTYAFIGDIPPAILFSALDNTSREFPPPPPDIDFIELMD